LYVDVNSTNPTPPYADLSTAAVTIQDAVDTATNGDLVLVNDGIYQVGCRTNQIVFPKSAAFTNRVVVDKSVIVQSLNGPAVTFINGDGIYRCVCLTNGAALNGFTLQNGTAGYGNGGGVCGFTLFGGVVSNCVLTGNSANGSGGGAYGVTLVNCQLTGNSAGIGGGAASCDLVGCIVTGNTTPATGIYDSFLPLPDTGGGINGGSAINCVIAGNSA
jgi:hypothetical protein